MPIILRVCVFFEGKGGHDVWGTLLFLPLNFHTGKENPRVGIFYFACFSKNGRNHSGEWFDFEKKVLKTSIKSMHGQQVEK